MLKGKGAALGSGGGYFLCLPLVGACCGVRVGGWTFLRREHGMVEFKVRGG